MRYAFVAAHSREYSVKLMCCVLKIRRGGFYAWLGRPLSKRAQEDERLLELIRAAHKRSRQTYGSPRIYRDLLAQGVKCSKKRVERLMRDNGIRAKRKHKFVTTTDSKHGFPVAENLLNQEFKVDEPNKVWASDITYVSTDEGWLYLAGVLDLCHKKLVGWSMSDRIDRTLVMDALRSAYRRSAPGSGLVHHSDRGSQYACGDYQNLLARYGMRPSMSRKGNCWDNAPMESFFGTLKKELVHHRHYRTRDEAKQDIFEYIEVFYNRERIHSSLGYLSPAEYEARIALQQAA